MRVTGAIVGILKGNLKTLHVKVTRILLNHIYNKISNYDWFSMYPFFRHLVHDHVGVQLQLFVTGVNYGIIPEIKNIFTHIT